MNKYPPINYPENRAAVYAAIAGALLATSVCMVAFGCGPISVAPLPGVLGFVILTFHKLDQVA